jgi:hypothetical protein
MGQETVLTGQDWFSKLDWLLLMNYKGEWLISFQTKHELYIPFTLGHYHSNFINKIILLNLIKDLFTQWWQGWARSPNQYKKLIRYNSRPRYRRFNTKLVNLEKVLVKFDFEIDHSLNENADGNSRKSRFFNLYLLHIDK